MLSRLTPAAKSVVVHAYEGAVGDGVGEIREDHLLEAVLADPEGARLLGALRVADLPRLRGELDERRRRAGLTTAEAAALSGMGIDIEAVVKEAESRFGDNALADPGWERQRWWHQPRFSADATRVLEEAERHLAAAGGRTLSVDHLVLALVTAPTALADSLARRGITRDGVRDALGVRSVGRERR